MELIAWVQSVAGFLANPGQATVVVLTLVAAPPVTFLAVQTLKRQYYASTGQEYSPARIQRCSWAWYVVVSMSLQLGLYWGTPSRPSLHVAGVSTLLGLVCYVGTIEWWIDMVRRTRPQLWARIRTRRRSTDRLEAEAAAAQVRSPDPDVTNH